MGNENLTADIIVKDGLKEFKNNTPFLQGLSRQYDKSYSVAGAEEGDQVRIERPKQFTMRSGKVAQVQDNKESSVILATTRQRGCDIRFSSAELKQDIGVFGPKYIRPAIQTITSGIEAEILADVYAQTGQSVGTPGTDPATQLVIGQAKAKLTKSACPMGERSMLVSPDASTSLVNGLGSNRFEAKDQIRNQFLTGDMGVFNGFQFSESNQVARHTTGTSDGAYALSADIVEGASSIVVDTGTGTLKAGDSITVAKMDKVNPRTKKSTGDLFQCSLAADYAGGAGTISINETIYASGPLQNVDALGLNNALVNEFATANSTSYDQNIGYHRDAFAFSTCDLPLYGNTDFESRQVMDGVSLRLEKVVDGTNDDFLYRFDMLYGFKIVIPEWVVRVWGK
mgnify:CR=1 FL=1